MTFKPAFEVTRVDSMQWNRTALTFELPTEATEDSAAAAPLPDNLMAELREAISFETALETANEAPQ